MRPFWATLIWLSAMLVVIWGLYLSQDGAHAQGGAHVGIPQFSESDLQPIDPIPQINDRVAYLERREVFPCGELCHDRLVTNPTRRTTLVPEPEHILLQHGETLWCLDCHSRDNHDVLTLIDGSEVGLNESHLLCGQCHGPFLRDWRHGVHGQRTGSWRDAKDTWPCVRCHNPHDPKFKPIKPEPPPRTRFQAAPVRSEN